MNNDSILCRYIEAHPDWETRLSADYGLKIHRDGAYAIFNYGYDSDFSDPVVQEARGIVLDIERLEPVCWPFRKFGNYHERYADEIDWATARVQEKVDGSIVKLWYDDRSGCWVFSTNGMIRADEARAGEDSNETYGDVIRSAENYGDIPFDALEKTYTYIFEMVSPKTQVVVLYERPMLYHTGTRSRVTGEEFDIDIGIMKPASYPLHSLEDCIRAAEALNAGDSVDKEGFVVVDAMWRRVKIKSPDYLVRHRIVENGIWTKSRVLELMITEGHSAAYLCEICPNDAHVFLYYAFRIEELKRQCDLVADYARALFTETEGDRHAVANVISDTKLAPVGFWALGHKKPGREWLAGQTSNRIAKLIPEYQPVGIGDLMKK